LTVARAKALDQAWQDRKAELALEQAQGRQAILGLASSASKENADDTTSASPATGEEDPAKTAARKQIEEREAARKGKEKKGEELNYLLCGSNYLCKLWPYMLRYGCMFFFVFHPDKYCVSLCLWF